MPPGYSLILSGKSIGDSAMPPSNLHSFNNPGSSHTQLLSTSLMSHISACTVPLAQNTLPYSHSSHPQLPEKASSCFKTRSVYLCLCSQLASQAGLAAPPLCLLSIRTLNHYFTLLYLRCDCVPTSASWLDCVISKSKDNVSFISTSSCLHSSWLRKRHAYVC